MASVIVNYEHHLNIRLFKWVAKMFEEKPDDKRMQAHEVILFRASIVGAPATTEVIALPYNASDLSPTDYLVLLHETLKRSHLLSSLDNLDWIAYHLLLRELHLKFGRLGARNSDFWVLVVFFDLKINRASREIPWEAPGEDMLKQLCCKRMPHISDLRVDGEVNLDKAEGIEACLKACPGMVVENSRGMEEIESCAEIGVLTGSEQGDAPECPICLAGMRVGYRYLTTCCGHKFHKECMMNWFGQFKTSCPTCRYPLL